MIYSSINRLLVIISLSLICTGISYAQFNVIKLPRQEASKKGNIGGRTQDLSPMALPFWDDFSFSNSDIYPHDTLWLFEKSVWLNNGIGLNPPSLGVVTFDGLNSLGRPYNINDVLAKGIADSLISRPISLNLITPAQRSTVFLSFYYQCRGNGEPPDPGDALQVLFKNADGVWIQVLAIENDGTFDPTNFTQVLIPVSDESYYHDKFQFKIQNFGRLSGPYDTWNIDYVYLNSGRSASDTSYPDRTINAPLTSMFDRYYSIPVKHFLQDLNSNIAAPTLSLHNLEFIPGNIDQSDVQPINYDSEDSVVLVSNGVETILTHTLDQATSIGNSLQPLEFRKTPIQTLPNISNITFNDTLATIKLKLWINSGDNITPGPGNPLGDYDSVKYAPIDFRYNDTTQIKYTLSNYYAYDDGSAEYGAALNQPGAQLAYLFDIKTALPDTLVALDLFFPSFGNDTQQLIEIQILSNLSGDPISLLHKEVVSVVRSSPGELWHLGLSKFVGVQNQFYVGWKQSSSSALAVGLDKSSDSSDKIFFNVNGQWEQPTSLTGNLMIRPIFGKGDGPITGILESRNNNVSIFPNPNRGNFSVSGNVDLIQLYDLAGQKVPFTMSDDSDYRAVHIHEPARGIYVLHLFSNGKTSSHKIMVE